MFGGSSGMHWRNRLAVLVLIVLQVLCCAKGLSETW